MADTKQKISVECNYPSNFIEVKGSRIHYLEKGVGDPVVFLHGMPTSSYLWRNILPSLSGSARCIAPDLIGMGKSDKPDIDYTVYDHIEYIENFITSLNLKNITLVLHGWGSVVGFDIARRNESRIKAVAFFESHIRPTTDWNMLSLPVQQLATLLNRPGASYRAVVQQNYLVTKLLPSGVIRSLDPVELENYEEPFPTPESRKPLWQYILDLPLGNGPDNVVNLISQYSDWLQQSSIPKLMLYAVPGFITTMATVQWATDHLKNIHFVALDNALHFAQESVPDLFGQKLREWYLSLATHEYVADTSV